MTTNQIIKHRFSADAPLPHEVAVGELCLSIAGEVGTLYTKTIEGKIVELGKGVTKLADLEDLDLTNSQDGSFIVQQGDKFVATNTIGSLDTLMDVEINNPQEGQYLRYDPVYLSFRNFSPTYSLFELLDVEVANPTHELESQAQHNHTLVYNHNTGKFSTRLRVNQLANLDDVNLQDPEGKYQILMLNEDLIWENMDLQIVRDTSPALGGNLNANSNYIYNTSYRVKTLTANVPILELNYAEADYFIIQGVPIETNATCILTPVFNLKNNTTAIMVLEIRQSTGVILIGGLENVKYEDGKAILLSGAGKTDLITITVQKTATTGTPPTITTTSYITATALNLAAVGEGGIPAYRYDKNRYPGTQVFDKASLYDDYFDYVSLLLNFEPEVSTNKIWSDDKSDLETNTVTTTTTNKAIPIYTFGIQERVAEFQSDSNYISVSASTPIVLQADFTIELFVNYPLRTDYLNSTAVSHNYFLTNDNLDIIYSGEVADYTNTNPTIFQNTAITITLGSHSYVYPNAFNYFLNKETEYNHLALVRNGTSVRFFVNGIAQTPVSYEPDDPVTSISLSSISLMLKGIVNSVRLTQYARYKKNFIVPSMRFGLIGGANDILDAQVWDYYWQLDREFEYGIFC